MKKRFGACIYHWVNALTLDWFSTENWARTKKEVNYLMFLPIKFFHQKLPEFMKRNIRIQVSGALEKVPKATRDAITKAIDMTKNNRGIVVNVGLTYGGCAEIV